MNVFRSNPRFAAAKPLTFGGLLLAIGLAIQIGSAPDPQRQDNEQRQDGGQPAAATVAEDLSVPGGDGVDQKRQVPPAEGLTYGRLTHLGGEAYRSPAGLIYGPGSQQGHRLKHLQRHLEDDPDRPGKHGVFDGEMPAVLDRIDQAYRLAQRGEQTTTQQQGARTVHTVDLRSRIGYVGGEVGNRDQRPPARRLRIVLEGNRVITAFPL